MSSDLSDLTTPTTSSMADSHADEPDAVGLSDTHLSEQRRRMFDLINRLRNTGVQGDINVPVIAVVGAQSAGKSSLIESISGISLPRKLGTCTRCPTEVHLEYADAAWSCNVSLRRTGRAVTFGDTISNKVHVTERIRRAQRAILNPERDVNDFLHGLERDDDDRTFSSDCIVLKITGRDVTDLLFVDLPGFVAGGLDSERVMVEDLIRDYIRRDSCIVLATVACETDFENQPTYAFARQYDADGTRIVGVLTKPDRIEPGNHSLWTMHIQGASPRTAGTKWFCIKNPDTQAIDAGITWRESRRLEADFFRSKPPWFELSAGEFAGHLGTDNLTRKLSDMLYTLMMSSLPRIQQELEAALAETLTRLHELPPSPSSEPVSEIIRMVSEYTTEAERQTQGVPDGEGLLQQLNSEEETFLRDLRLTVPNYKPWLSTDGHRTHKALSMDFLLHEEDRVRDGLGPLIYVDQVMDDARRAVTRELPDNYPFVIQKRAILQFVTQWRTPALRLLSFSDTRVRELLQRLIDSSNHFGQYVRLKQLVTTIVSEHVTMRAEETQARIDFLLAMEAEVKTRNTHYFRSYRDKFLDIYKGVWRSRSPIAQKIIPDHFDLYLEGSPVEREGPFPAVDYEHSPTQLEKALHALARLGFKDLEAKSLLTLCRADPEENALFIMANVRAYFQVAYKRFGDNVPLAIDEAFVRGVVAGLQATILSNLGVGGREGYETCLHLLQEPSHITQRRTELQAKEKRLKEAKQEFMRLSVG